MASALVATAVPPLPAAQAEIVAGLDSALQPLALLHRQRALAAGLPFTFISGLRSRSQQGALATDPTRTTPAAKAGQSKHEVGFAYDIAGTGSGLTADQLTKIGGIGESLGLVWGGRFVDPVTHKPTPDANHFEAASARAVLAAYRNTKIAAGFALIAGVGLIITEGT